ncbi:acylaminoacyl-peptidase [Xylogone sp. PMI_703]|nr:acylaminoacyl-peptidase [Xylogone sp. PMI_703]
MSTFQLPNLSPGSLAQHPDLRGTEIWKEVESHFQQLHGPAFGKVTGASDLTPSPDGSKLTFTGSILEKLEGTPYTRICLADIAKRTFTIITRGPHSDRSARWSPDGRSLAFVSDRTENGVFQPYLLELNALGEARPLGRVDGTVESVSWSPCGTKVLFGVAGRGADKAGPEGSGTTAPKDRSNSPAWLPSVQPDLTIDPWRTAWVYDKATEKITQVGRAGLNFWEVAWCGNDDVIAIISSSPTEGAWSTASLAIVSIATGKERVLYRSPRQLGLPVATPSVKKVALIEGLCSDRGIVAGDVVLVDITQQSATILASNNVDVSQLEWQGDENLFFLGLRGLDTVAGTIDISTQTANDIWISPETCGGRFPQGCLLAESKFAVVHESWTRYPEIAVVHDGQTQTISSLDHDGARYLRSRIGPIERVSWNAPDGLEIQGFLCLPNTGKKPHALILYVHGGPNSAFKNKWTMQYPVIALLNSCGYAVLCPNPRGSKGRGKDFAMGVYGDMGGADTYDLLSGVDAMINRGIADPTRIGVTGGSYGGYMSAWLITQSDRFAAAVPSSPVTDWVSLHTTCNNGSFDQDFLQENPYSRNGLYFSRSPLNFAGRYPTPVLQIAGELDRCTPATQAIQYHNALIEHGVTSVVAVYPGEGHGVKAFPAVVDYCSRVLSWFRDYMAP